MIDLNSSNAMETLTIPELVSLFKSSPSNPNSDQIACALVSKHQKLSEALKSKEAARMELESRCEALSTEYRELEAKLEKTEEELRGCKITIDNLKREVSDLYVEVMAGKFDKEVDVIVISDGEDAKDSNCNLKNNMKDGDAKCLEDVDFILTPNLKRKHLSRVVSSDSEDDEDKELNESVAVKRKRVSRVVDSDNEDEDNEHGKEKDKITSVHWSLDHIVKEGDETEKNLLFSSTPKRKNELRVVTDSQCNDEVEDDDDDDNIPLAKLRLRKHRDYDGKISNVTPTSRRLVKLGACNRMKAGESPIDFDAHNSKTASSLNLRTRSTVRQKLKLSDTEEDEDEDEVKNGDSDSEGDSLDEFIVSGSDSHGSESSADEGSDGEVKSCGDSVEEDSGSDVDFDDVLTALRRDKHDKEWEFEAEMLASFGKDPELCMKAVCTLYRQQTSEEQSAKETIVLNNRGFSQPDAPRASAIAEFLLDGDKNGPLKKSVEELEERFSDGLDYCHKIATHYSKQLFMIYKQKEDPFFCPS